jgi:dTMP kinase
LVEELRDRGIAVTETHEPGGTRLGDEVRRLVLLRDDLQVSRVAEALLMNASRAQLVEQVVRPALRRGEVVVCDRYTDSTLAYQGAGRGLPEDDLRSVLSFATGGLRPDLTLLLDVPVEVGLARKGAGADEDWNRFEAEALAFHQRVRRAYLALAEAEPQRWCRLDGQRSIDDLAHDIWGVVAARREKTL